MLILKIKNNVGPGNQMFMYARAYALAKKYNQKIIIISEISNDSVRQNILQYMMLDKTVVKAFYRIDWIKNKLIYRIIRKIIFDIFLKLPFFYQIINEASKSRIKEDDIIIKKNRVYVLDGYFECHEYFDEYRNELIAQYVPNYFFNDEVLEMINKIENCNSVAVHIRKGDFKEFGRLMPDDYYEKKMEEIKLKVGNPVFFILTEDTKIRKLYSNKIGTVVINFDTKHKYIDEWYVLSKCKHHIIANSTYSWWSSYISNHDDKLIIKPKLTEYLEAEKNNNDIMYRNYYL